MPDQHTYDFVKIREVAESLRSEKDNITSRDFYRSLTGENSQAIQDMNQAFSTYEQVFCSLRCLYEGTAAYLDLICTNYENAEDAMAGDD